MTARPSRVIPRKWRSTLVANARRQAPCFRQATRRSPGSLTEVAMLSRTIVSVLAFSSTLGVASLAGADAGGMYVRHRLRLAVRQPREHHVRRAIQGDAQTNLKQSSTRLEGAVVTVAAPAGAHARVAPAAGQRPGRGGADRLPARGKRGLGPRDLDRRRLRDHGKQRGQARRQGDLRRAEALTAK